MNGFEWSVLLAAVAVGFIHTVLGPDHYVPFLMMARAQHWSRSKTVAVALLCGIGHVGSSVVLGGVGVVLGLTVAHLERVEGTRGSVAAWALVAFGVAYAVWGLRRALRRSRGIEAHDHGGHVHVHAHGNRPHRHAAGAATPSVTFWALFTVFVLGPCEPLIPLFMLPASRGQWGLAAATAAVFGAVTLASMAVLTLLGVTGLERIPLGPLERWSHAMAGAVIAASGLFVIALGL